MTTNQTTALTPAREELATAVAVAADVAAQAYANYERQLVYAIGSANAFDKRSHRRMASIYYSQYTNVIEDIDNMVEDDLLAICDHVIGIAYDKYFHC